MKIRYTVHSVAAEEVQVPAMAGDRPVTATVLGLVVELLDGERHGHTFHFVPADDADMAAHRAIFAPGATVTASFAPGE